MDFAKRGESRVASRPPTAPRSSRSRAPSCHSSQFGQWPGLLKSIRTLGGAYVRRLSLWVSDAAVGPIAEKEKGGDPWIGRNARSKSLSLWMRVANVSTLALQCFTPSCLVDSQLLYPSS